MMFGEYVLPALVMVSSVHTTVRVLDARYIVSRSQTLIPTGLASRDYSLRIYMRAALRHLYITTPLVTTPT